MKHLKPTNRHQSYNQALYNRNQTPVIAIGCAGTGKTYGAVKRAISWIEQRGNRVVVTRPNVHFADQSGYLPGTEREKIDPWVRPVQQLFEQLGISASEQQYMEKCGQLTFVPLESIQGLTFDNALIIVDECQNLSFKQLQVLLTRTGQGSQLVLCGDVAQISPLFKNSGLAELIQMIDHFGIPVDIIEFTREDVLRSEQCKRWICAFEDWEMKRDGELYITDQEGPLL